MPSTRIREVTAFQLRTMDPVNTTVLATLVLWHLAARLIVRQGSFVAQKYFRVNLCHQLSYYCVGMDFYCFPRHFRLLGQAASER